MRQLSTLGNTQPLILTFRIFLARSQLPVLPVVVAPSGCPPQHTCSAAPPRSSASPKLSLGSGVVSSAQSYSQTGLTIPAG